MSQVCGLLAIDFQFSKEFGSGPGREPLLTSERQDKCYKRAHPLWPNIQRGMRDGAFSPRKTPPFVDNCILKTHGRG